jgi:hypothetical protein
VATARRHRHRAGEALPQPLDRSTGSARTPLDDVLPTGWVLLGDVPDDVAGSLERPTAGVAEDQGAELAEGRGTVEVAEDREAAGISELQGASDVAEDPDAEGAAVRGRDAAGPIVVVPFRDGDGLRDWLLPATVVLVRPDRVVFGTAGPGHVAGLLAGAARWSGVDPARPAATDRPVPGVLRAR